jgi:hypothetical protein
MPVALNANSGGVDMYSPLIDTAPDSFVGIGF